MWRGNRPLRSSVTRRMTRAKPQRRKVFQESKNASNLFFLCVSASLREKIFSPTHLMGRPSVAGIESAAGHWSSCNRGVTSCTGTLTSRTGAVTSSHGVSGVVSGFPAPVPGMGGSLAQNKARDRMSLGRTGARCSSHGELRAGLSEERSRAIRRGPHPGLRHRAPGCGFRPLRNRPLP